MSLMPIISPRGAPVLSFQTHTIGQQDAPNATITYPSLIAGDLLVLMHSGSGDTAPANVIPSGWTSIYTLVEGSKRVSGAYKIATGSETGSFGVLFGSFGGEGGNGSRSLMATFRCTRPIASVTVSTPNTQSTTDVPDTQNVAASGGTPPLVVLGFLSSDGAAGGGTQTVTTRTLTPTKDGEFNTENGVTSTNWLLYKIYNSAPSDTTVVQNDAGTNAMASCYISVS